jgi:DNA repair exonuclease SbcCD nuclease subunit
MAKTNSDNKNNDKLALGDLVYIIPKNGDTTPAPTQTGEIESIRGSGWYSIRIDDNDNNKDNIIKCRGSQIQRLENSDDTVTPNASASDERTGSINDNIRKITINNDLKTRIPYSSLEIIDNNNGMEDVNSFAAEILSEVSHPPPIIYDLDAAILTMKTGGSSVLIEERIIQQAAHHATYKKWVVFTDLHCSPTTLDTCLEVLHIVHATALKQTEKCGVLFLGDFWHHRGTLRVDCLNAILNEFRLWQVPMIMIPGNHDQVTLGGQNHGLTPLENSYRVVGPGGDDVPGPLILSHPTIFQNALFVPHVRDMDIMKSIVQSNKAKESSALFVHTEVKGALMNDMIVSTNGISPSVFPPQKNIYSGHFHKPHSVETSSSSSSSSTIEYIGSPYQVSLSEAQQEKQLVVLDADLGWRCEQRIPICVGRCHFKSSSLEELQQYRLITGHEEDESTIAAAADGTIRVKKGDRIVMNIPKKEQRGLEITSDDTAMKSQIQLLRDQGVAVEVREVSSNNDNLSSPTMLANDSVEDMSPVSTWRAYLKDAEMRNEFVNENDHDSLLEIGLKILEEIESTGGVQNRGVQHDLRLTSTSATGFGPFEDTITYPLENRGLVLLRGKC